MAKIDIAGRLHSVATGNIVTGADEVLDDRLGQKQNIVNANVQAAIAQLSDEDTAITQRLALVERMKDKSVGLFSTVESLNAKEPSPKVGEWALVGTSSPFAVYECATAGTWTATGGTYDAGEINLADYATVESVEAIDEEVSRIPTIDTDVEYDLSFTDVAGNRLVGFKDGHIQTKNFDSAKAFDDIKVEDAEPDLEIKDDKGYILSTYKDGHIQTKNFDSAKIGVEVASLTDADLDIKDENGNTLAQFIGGGIRTKNFDSSDAVFAQAYPIIGSPQVYHAPVNAISQQTADFVSGHFWGTGSVAYLYGLYDALVTAHPFWFHKETNIGMDQSDTFEMRHYTIRVDDPMLVEDRKNTPYVNVYSDTDFKPRRILLTMGMHAGNKTGGEPWSLYGGYLAVKAILEGTDEWAMFIKRNFVIDIVPCINPWAMEVGLDARNSRNVNINRNFRTKTEQETKNMVALIQDLIPKGLVAVLDTHNSGKHDQIGFMVSKPYYKSYRYTVLMTQSLKPIVRDMVEAINAVDSSFIDDTSFFCFNYVDESDAVGQLHEYADSLGLMASTIECVNEPPSWLVTQTLVVNILSAYGKTGAISQIKNS